MLKSIIIEDEPLAAKLLEKYAKRTEGIKVIAKFSNAIIAKKFLIKNEVDLIFLDIDLPYVKGFDFIDSLNQNYKIILTTAYSQFALKGFEKGVIDYLVKPILYRRFEQAIDRLIDLLSTDMANSKSLIIQISKTKVRLIEKDITHIESSREYVNLFLHNKSIYRTKKSTKEMERILSDNFIRVHKSFIVNKTCVTSLSSSVITVMDDTIIPIGRKYKIDVHEALSAEMKN